MWPTSLITELARRRCLIFIGSGVSATAKNSQDESPQTWGDFVTEALKLVKDDSLAEDIKKIISDKNYLLALHAIKTNSDPSDYTSLLDKSFNKKYNHSKVHELIYALDSRIIITTNFDKIYENYCESNINEDQGFKVVCYNDSASLGNLIRSDTRIIIKAHGSINTTESMIFTMAEYHEAKKSYPAFYTILQALFITHTCLFIGCSMDDPDINLLLEDVKIASNATHPHYVLVKTGATSLIKTNNWRDTYNIKALEYGENYEDLPKVLEKLVDAVSEQRAFSPEA